MCGYFGVLQNENVVFNADSGWTTTSANVSTLRKACRQNTDNNNWTVSMVTLGGCCCCLCILLAANQKQALQH